MAISVLSDHSNDNAKRACFLLRDPRRVAAAVGRDVRLVM
jgi:hypothetical protein